MKNETKNEMNEAEPAVRDETDDGRSDASTVTTDPTEIEDLRKEIDELKRRLDENKSIPPIDAGAGVNNEPALTREVLAKMSPAEISLLDWAAVTRVLSAG